MSAHHDMINDFRRADDIDRERYESGALLYRQRKWGWKWKRHRPRQRQIPESRMTDGKVKSGDLAKMLSSGDEETCAHLDRIIDYVIDMLAEQASTRVAAGLLDTASRRVVISLALSGKRLSERDWRSIFDKPPRPYEKNVYDAMIAIPQSISAVPGLLAGIFSLGGRAGPVPWWFGVVIIGSSILFFIFVGIFAKFGPATVDVERKLLDAFILICLPVLLAVYCVGAGFWLIPWTGVTGSLIASLAVFTIFVFGWVCGEWRTPDNPVREAVRSSRLNLSRSSTVLSDNPYA